MPKARLIGILLVAASALIVGSCARNPARAAAPPPPWPSYPYGSKTFEAFVADSYNVAGAGSTRDFFDWMDRAFEDAGGSAIESYTVKTREGIRSAANPESRTAREIQSGRELHRILKRAIPRFSLDRGFEFYQTEALGERQCFLQSVVLAGLLQKCGIEAGVAMVFLNEKGDSTNNGHAVTVMRLANGTDLVVDASEPYPFATHRGLFMANAQRSGFAYVRPRYAQGEVPAIARYEAQADGTEVPPTGVAPLDTRFLQSQFDYYRGERAPGGVLAKDPTRAGLEQSARFLEKSVAECPENPLAVYMLGTVYASLGDGARARSRFEDAKRLYEADGWVPGGLTQALKGATAGGTTPAG